MIKNNKELINEAKMMEEIRSLLGLTIEDFVYQMDWPNSKYYDYIKHGRKRTGQDERQATHPTIYKVFTGINTAIEQHENWKEKSSEITAIVIHYLMPKA